MTNNSCKILISTKESLPCMPLKPCTNEECGTLPYDVLASCVDWDLIVLDCLAEENEE